MSKPVQARRSDESSTTKLGNCGAIITFPLASIAPHFPFKETVPIPLRKGSTWSQIGLEIHPVAVGSLQLAIRARRYLGGRHRPPVGAEREHESEEIAGVQPRLESSNLSSFQIGFDWNCDRRLQTSAERQNASGLDVDEEAPNNKVIGSAKDGVWRANAGVLNRGQPPRPERFCSKIWREFGIDIFVFDSRSQQKLWESRHYL